MGKVDEEMNLNQARKPLSGKQKIPQYFAAIAATMASFCAGCSLAWTSPTMNRLQGKSGSYEPMDHPLSDEEVSWVTSLLALGAILGPLWGGIFIDRFGRKYTFMVFGGVPAIIGWVIILAARNPAALYAARLLTGLSTGSASTLGAVYIAEVSSASERGTLCSLPQLMITLGIMVQYTVGPYVSYYVLAGINLAFPVIFLVSFFFMPESPYYLLAAGKREEAEKSLIWLRGGGRLGSKGIGKGHSTVDVTKELEAMSVAIENSGIRDSSLVDSFKDIFATTGNRRALLVTCGLMLNQQLSGINAVLFNAESIFRGSNADSPLLGASESAMVIGAVQIVFSWLETLLADRAGRRPLLLVSSGFSSLSLVALGVHSYLDKYQHSVALGLTWLPITSLILYIVFYCFGLGPLPWAVLGELFPSSAKSSAGILSGCMNWTVAFIVTRTFQPLIDSAGAYGTYWFYASCCAAGFVFLTVLLPETKCKTLEEIQKELGGD